MPDVTLRMLINTGDPIAYQDGTPMAGIKLTFTLVELTKKQPTNLFDAISGEMIVGMNKVVTTDEAGEFTVALWPNSRGEFATAYKVSSANGKLKPFYINILDSITTLSLVDAKASLSEVTQTEQTIIDKLLIDAAEAVVLAEAFAVTAGTQADIAVDNAAATNIDAVATAADAVQTALDRIATAANQLQTGLDRVATGGDVSQTGLDKIATAADRVQTGLDVIATNADAMQTALDRIQTDADAVWASESALATAADVVQADLDVTVTTAGAATALAAVIEANARLGDTIAIGQQVELDNSTALAAVITHTETYTHADIHVPGSDNQDLSGLVVKVTGSSLVADTEIAKIHGVNDVNSSSATAAQGLLADTALQPGDQAAVGTVSTFYLDHLTAIADNQFLSPAPSTYAQEVDSVAVASGTNGGIGFIERFVSGPLGVTSIPAGTWSFHNFCYASNLTGNNKIITRINKRCLQTGMTGTFTGAGATRTFTVTGGAPFVAGDANASILLSSLIETPTQTAWISGFTSSSVVTVTLTDIAFVNVSDVTLNAIYYLIFNTESGTPDITSSSATTPMHADFEVVQATTTAVDPTDRIVAAYFAYTDQVSSRTINLLHGGSSFYSKIGTPLLGNLITQTITNGATTTAPSEDAIYDALANKMPNVTPGTSGNVLTSNGSEWTSAASAASQGFKVTLLPGSFNLTGAAAEPMIAPTDGTNFDCITLQYIDGATEWNSFFSLPSRLTAGYQGGNIKIDIDFLLVGGTLTNTHTIIMGVGLIEINADGAIDTAPPTSSTGYSSTTYTLDASEVTLTRRTITITITADASISAGQHWNGRLIRRTSTDTSVAAAYVTGMTVYE